MRVVMLYDCYTYASAKARERDDGGDAAERETAFVLHIYSFLFLHYHLRGVSYMYVSPCAICSVALLRYRQPHVSRITRERGSPLSNWDPVSFES